MTAVKVCLPSRQILEKEWVSISLCLRNIFYCFLTSFDSCQETFWILLITHLPAQGFFRFENVCFIELAVISNKRFVCMHSCNWQLLRLNSFGTEFFVHELKKRYIPRCLSHDSHRRSNRMQTCRRLFILSRDWSKVAVGEAPLLEL